MRWVSLLLVAALASIPETVLAARRVFIGELAAKVGGGNPGHGRQLRSSNKWTHGGDLLEETEEGEDDLLQLVDEAYDAAHTGHHGYGGDGCGRGYYCYGYYGYYGYGGHPGYGGGDIESEEDFEHLVDTAEVMGELLDGHGHRLPGHVQPHDKYDVYGMPAGEAEMSRRVLRAEQMSENGKLARHLIQREFLLDVYEVDYSEWEEAPEISIPWAPGALWYGRYRGTADGMYGGCIGYYGYGYANGYGYGCGSGPYGGLDELVDDAEAAQDLLLEVEMQLKGAVKKAAKKNQESAAEEGYLGAITIDPDMDV